MNLKDKVLKNTTLKHTSILSESELFEETEPIPTNVPLLNVALSGRVNGGISRGLLQIAANSKHFKTGFSLLLASTFLNHDPNAIVLLYVSEFGSPKSYFVNFNVDMERVILVPITDIEQLKHDATVQLTGIQRGDKVMIIVDSLGNLASKKEIEDALEGKPVADMTRARAVKSFFRIVTPHLTLKNIPMVVINHVYKEIGTMYPKDIVGGGTGSYYSSDNIWIVGRQQEKEDKDVVGYNFIINVDKSRYIWEKSKIPIYVSHEHGIDRWSGLLELALQGGYLEKDKLSYVSNKHFPDEKFGPSAFEAKRDEIFTHLLEKTDFSQYIESLFSINSARKE